MDVQQIGYKSFCDKLTKNIGRQNSEKKNVNTLFIGSEINILN